MKTTLIILTVLTVVLLFSTIICGLWLRYSGEPVEESSIQFHMMIALTACLAAGVTIWLALSNLFKLAA